MRCIVMTSAVAAFIAAMAASGAAEAYIGEGVQGRPHGGKSAVRAYYWRHGLKVPSKYRHRRHYNY